MVSTRLRFTGIESGDVGNISDELSPGGIQWPSYARVSASQVPSRESSLSDHGRQFAAVFEPGTGAAVDFRRREKRRWLF